MVTDSTATASARSYGRQDLQMRPVQISLHPNEFAHGSVLVEFGRTRVVCTATLEKSVPGWLQGQQRGWVTAEYSMLPAATPTRSRREREKIGGRTQEIQRLIGRSLRAVVDLKKIPEKSIVVDCDVLVADGGTRTASITGGYVALALALRKFNLETALTGQVAALSVGMKGDRVLVDLDYLEDSSCDVDMNFVMLQNGRFVEIQGTGEQATFAASELQTMMNAALASREALMASQSDMILRSKTTNVST